MLFDILIVLFDILGSVCALAVPLIILHWFMGILQIPPFPSIPIISDILNILSFILDFFIQLVDTVIHPPSIQFQGHMVSTSEGIVALLFLILFMGFNALSQSLRTSRQRLAIMQHTQIRKADQKKVLKQQDVDLKGRQGGRILLHITCEGMNPKVAWPFLEKSATNSKGREIFTPTSDTWNNRVYYGWTLEFNQLFESLSSSVDIGRQILHYYATLRPMDAQPPFRMGIHVIDSDVPLDDRSLKAVQLLVHFAGPNQIMFSSAFQQILVADRIANQAYPFQSMGFYTIDQKQQELFRLLLTL